MAQFTEMWVLSVSITRALNFWWSRLYVLYSFPLLYLFCNQEYLYFTYRKESRVKMQGLSSYWTFRGPMILEEWAFAANFCLFICLFILISSIFDKCSILLQMIWPSNHTSDTKVYFNEFFANTLRDNIQNKSASILKKINEAIFNFKSKKIALLCEVTINSICKCFVFFWTRICV